MIVYVESNFVLEIALGQEQADSAQQILSFAETGIVDLAIPSFGLSEPFSRIRQQARDRQRLHQAMRPVELELRRTHHARALADALRPLGEAMLSLERSELDRLELTVTRVLEHANVIELDNTIFQSAIRQRDEIDLELEDSIIFSCILADLERRPGETAKCFVSKDAKAFFDPAVDAQLAEHDCRYVSRFPQAVDFIRSATTTPE